MAAWQTGLLFFHPITAIFFILIITNPPAVANPLSFDHPSFNKGDMNLEGDALVSDSQIEITANKQDQNNNYNYSVGRVTSKQHMQLWDTTSRDLSVDFSTKFSFKISSEQKGNGHGMAFFLADPNLPFLKNIVEGGGLGLVDGNQVLNSTKSFVAVEFDTYQNPWDPSGWHVGINLNSMKSCITEPLSSDPQIFDFSIEYNSATHNLSVSYYTFIEESKQWGQKYLPCKVDLREQLPERVTVGFSAATGNWSEKYTLLAWSFFSSSSDSQISPRTTTKRNIGRLMWIVLGIAIAVCSLGLICFLMGKWKKTKGNEEEEEEEEEEFISDLNMDVEFQKGSGPKKFCHGELVTATNNFSKAEKLGHGGFGDVYKGFFKDINSYVAIKRISRDSKQGIKEYATEVKIISQLRHRNLVQLIGWCHKKKDLLLIYEYMPNGSLDSHLYNGKNFLTWELRYNIALDLASALFYLHEEWDKCVLHRDIKSSNIMLDSSFNAKLGDFGLARLVDHKKGSQTTVIAGTRGYIAPEYFITSKASKKSDIYSFGVVLLEIATGRKPIDQKAGDEITIVEWVWELYGLGKLLEVADPKLCGAFNKQQMERLVVVGIWCAHPDPSSRPSIRQVIYVLNFEAPLPILPQKMPVLTYHPPTINAVVS